MYKMATNFKKVLIFFMTLGVLISSVQSVSAGYVNGYYKSNGTYVNGYYRSNPDGNPYNNYSFPGNTNPYTGETAGGSASSYLNNYYNNSSGGSYTPSYLSTPNCPLNSYSSGSFCKCNYGYVVSGASCVSANTLCHAQLGPMSSYDSLSQSCKCDYSYVIGSAGACIYESSTYPLYSESSYSNISSRNNCPANSKESLTDSDKCTCNLGYEVDKNKIKCVKIKKATNDKLCRADFGSKSEWTGKYDKETESPYCGCKKKYEWSGDGKSCVKS